MQTDILNAVSAVTAEVSDVRNTVNALHTKVDSIVTKLFQLFPMLAPILVPLLGRSPCQERLRRRQHRSLGLRIFALVPSAIQEKDGPSVQGTGDPNVQPPNDLEAAAHAALSYPTRLWL